jgi:Uma2 family endonuclease
MLSSRLWTCDPDDPRAPARELWAQMTEAERANVVATLPSDFPPSESSPPEGDRHYEAYTNARETLTRWFRERGRNVYISGNLPVYYPGERMFSPDVIAVVDVPPHPRDSWIVSHEANRGLDFALEVIVSGKRRKDLHDNVQRYAMLGIAEYFVFDRSRSTLHAYRLNSSATPADHASSGARYERLVPQAGRYASNVLGLDLRVENGRLRFLLGDAELPDSTELLSKLGALVNDSESRAVELEAALEEEQKRREEEQKRREDVEAELAALKAELAELRLKASQQSP